MACLATPVMAAVTFTPPENNVDGVAAIKAVGSLHLSEGRVIIQHNQIVMLSDAGDAMTDAELSGSIIEAHVGTEAGASVVRGVAVFIRGYSLAALDDVRVKDVVKGNDGQDRVGRIVDVTPKMLRIKTAAGIVALPTKYITEVKSPRAFSFSLPLTAGSVNEGATASTRPTPESASASMTLTGTATSLAAAPKAVPTNLISFSPTYVRDPNVAQLPPQTKSLHAQLTERHPNRRVVKTAAVVAGVAACFAIPTAVALTCPRPKNAAQ